MFFFLKKDVLSECKLQSLLFAAFKPATSVFCFSPKNESSCDSDLILIANLLHASVASVLHSPHDAVTIVLWPSMTESLKQSKLSEGFYIQTS